MFKPLLTAALLALLSGTSAHAESNEDLTRYLRDEIAQMQESVDQCTLDRAVESSDDPSENWFYRRFWIRVRAKAAFQVPGLAKLEIVPETELLWERELPEGWAAYKPRH
jgi:hypothetical protein